MKKSYVIAMTMLLMILTACGKESTVIEESNEDASIMATESNEADVAESAEASSADEGISTDNDEEKSEYDSTESIVDNSD